MGPQPRSAFPASARDPWTAAPAQSRADGRRRLVMAYGRDKTWTHEPLQSCRHITSASPLFKTVAPGPQTPGSWRFGHWVASKGPGGQWVGVRFRRLAVSPGRSSARICHADRQPRPLPVHLLLSGHWRAPDCAPPGVGLHRLVTGGHGRQEGSHHVGQPHPGGIDLIQVKAGDAGERRLRPPFTLGDGLPAPGVAPDGIAMDADIAGAGRPGLRTAVPADLPPGQHLMPAAVRAWAPRSGGGHSPRTPFRSGSPPSASGSRPGRSCGSRR